MIKRVHYPIDKQKIQEAIDAYIAFAEKGEDASWDKYYELCNKLCPHSYTWCVATSMFQPMYWAKTLTVENVYYAILAMGVNTRLEEVYDD